MSHLIRITTSSDFNGNLLTIPLAGRLTLNALPCVDRLWTLWLVGSLLLIVLDDAMHHFADGSDRSRTSCSRGRCRLLTAAARCEADRQGDRAGQKQPTEARIGVPFMTGVEPGTAL